MSFRSGVWGFLIFGRGSTSSVVSPRSLPLGSHSLTWDEARETGETYCRAMKLVS